MSMLHAEGGFSRQGWLLCCVGFFWVMHACNQCSNRQDCEDLGFGKPVAHDRTPDKLKLMEAKSRQRKHGRFRYHRLYRFDFD